MTGAAVLAGWGHSIMARDVGGAPDRIARRELMRELVLIPF